MRFVYADPSLVSDLGHHATACRLITSELRARGIIPTVLVSGKADKALLSELQAVPHFRFNAYVLNDGDPICGWLNAFFVIAEITSHDLARISDLGPDDVIYFNSIGAAQLMAIAIWANRFPSQQLPRIIVEFTTEPGVDPTPDKRTYQPRDPRVDPRAAFYRFAMMRFPPASAGMLHLNTHERFTSSVFSDVLKFPVGWLPLYFGASGSLQTRVGKRPVTIGILGHQRPDKGYHLVPDVVRSLLQSREDIRFLVHNGAPADMSREQQVLRDLAATDRRITIDERTAGPAAWHQLIAACDLMLCPYDPRRYYASWSAVAIDALANGIPLVGPTETSLHRLILEYGGFGATFDQFEPPSIVDATLRALARYDHFAQIASVGAQKFALTNGPPCLVDAILSYSQAKTGRVI